MDDIIKINNLRKCFKDIVAVNDLSFKVKKGEFFAFISHVNVVSIKQSWI